MTPSGWWSWARRNADWIVFGLALAGVVALPSGGHDGIAVLGVVSGGAIALQALGVILILRSNRIINFAQAQLGAITGLLFYELVRHNQFVVFAEAACSQCLRGIPQDGTFLQTNPTQFTGLLIMHGYGNWIVANWVISLVLSLLVAPLVSWLVYTLVVRRFDNAPRLIATVVTIALAQLLIFLAGILPQNVFQDTQVDLGGYPIGDPRIGFIYPTSIHLTQVITVAVALAATGGLALLFKLTRAGVAMRGIADNPKRAQTVGVPVASLASLSWLLAGALSGIAAVLKVSASAQSPVSLTQGSTASSFDVATTVIVLAVVVLARQRSLLLGLLAALGIEVIDQVMFHQFNAAVWFQAALPLIIGLALLLQSVRRSRAEDEATAGYLGSREARPIPRQLRYLPVVSGWIRWGVAAGAVILIGYPFVMSPGQVSLGEVILIWSMIGLSLLVLTGWAGQISLGQFAFAAVGGYVTAYLAGSAGWFMLLALIGGGLAGAVVAAVVGIPALRLRGLNLAVMTLALALAVTSLLLNPLYLGKKIPAELNRPVLLGVDLSDERAFFYLCLGFLVLYVLIVLGLRRSRTARALIACRDNEQAAQSFGINLFRARLEAFVISGFLAAFAGGLFAFQQHNVTTMGFGADQSLGIFLMTVIGGLGSVSGPIVGALYQAIFLLLATSYLTLADSLGVIAVLLLFPGGLAGILYRLRDAMLRRVAIRRRILVPGLFAGDLAARLQERAPIAAKQVAGGAEAFVPEVYSVGGQWAVGGGGGGG